MRVYILTVVLSAGLVACSMAPLDPVAGKEKTDREGLTLSQQQHLLTMINNLRETGCSCGDTYMPPAQPLSLHSQLTEAATVHARDMAQNNHFAHRGTDGSRVGERLRRTGYSWSRVGENIAWGYAKVEAVFQGWRDSDGHCENMMAPGFVHLGAARQGSYWVTTFGREQ